MIRPIMKDVLFLGQKSDQATKADQAVIQDLKDTLKAHEAECVGMAANMIGVKKRIIIVSVGIGNMIMVNPVIVAKKKAYETEEGCLSLIGARTTMRYEQIEVEYENESFQKKRETFTGWTAQIIQHEVDHCDGIII